MKSLRELYKVGRGPSSSHTIGPQKACDIFLNKNINADSFRVVLYGSLAKTGKGHRTDFVIKKTFSPKECEVIFDTEKEGLPHPNTMELTALYPDGSENSMVVMSIGGGAIRISGCEYQELKNVYSLSKFSDILNHCLKNPKNQRVISFL